MKPTNDASYVSGAAADAELVDDGPRKWSRGLTISAILLAAAAAAAARGAAVAVAAAASPPAARGVSPKAAPVVAPSAAVVPTPFPAGAFSAARQKSVATASVGGARASVVMSLEWCLAFAAEHRPVKKEVTELVVVDAAAQASVERPENPCSVSFFGCVMMC